MIHLTNRFWYFWDDTYLEYSKEAWVIIYLIK